MKKRQCLMLIVSIICLYDVVIFAVTNTLTINGAFQVGVDANAITITTNSLDNIVVDGNVTLKVPTTNGKVIVNGVTYTSGSIKSGLMVEQSTSVDNFAVDGTLQVYASGGLSNYVAVVNSMKLQISGSFLCDGNVTGKNVETLVNTSYFASMSTVLLNHKQHPLNQQFGFAGKMIQSQIIPLSYSLNKTYSNNVIKQSLGYKSGTVNQFVPLGSAYVLIAGQVTVAGDITMRNNYSNEKNILTARAGVIIVSTAIVSEAGNIEIYNNTAFSNNNNDASVGVFLEEGYIVASGGDLTMYNNSAYSNTLSVGIYLLGGVEVSGNIVLNNNYSSSALNASAAIAMFYNIVAGGDVTMNNNIAGSAQELSIGVFNPVCQAGGNIIFIDNIGQDYGVTNEGSNISTNGQMVISLTKSNLSSKKVNLSNYAVIDSSSTDLSFTDFVIVIDNNLFGGVGGSSYAQMQVAYPGIITLNAANQT